MEEGSAADAFDIEAGRITAWARRRRRRAPAACSRCGSFDLRVLLLGMPAPWAPQALDEGLIQLGGCMVGYPGGDPEWACGRCGYWMRKDGSGLEAT
jgi:ribosomal protein S27AE